MTEVAAPLAEREESAHAVNATVRPQSVGALIDELYELNQRIKEVNNTLEDLKAQAELLQTDIMTQLDQQELTQCRGRIGKVGLTENVVPTVHDWEEFQKYILETGGLHLLERRPATKAWRELYESGEEVPGVAPFKKRGLSVRKA